MHMLLHGARAAPCHMRKEYCEANCRATDIWQPRRTSSQQCGAGEARKAGAAARRFDRRRRR